MAGPEQAILSTVSTMQVQAGGSLRLPMSFEAFEALGETKHHEYYDGLLLVNPPSRRHATVQSRLVRLLQDASPSGLEVLAEWGWLAAPETIFEPDVMVFESDAPGPDLLRVPPLLVVEVSSRSTRSEDWGRKRELYARCGAPEYWIVDPDAGEVTVLRNNVGTFTEVSRLRRGFQRLEHPFPVTLDLNVIFR